MTWKLGTCAACAAMWISATAGYSAISANFTDGNGTTTVDQFQGKSGNGWAGGWTSANTPPTVTATGTVINTAPLANGGNYLEATVTANSSSTSGSGAMLGRVMDTAANGGINTAQAFTINFDFRASNMPASGQSYTLFGNPTVGMAGSSNTWTVRAQSDGKWIIVYRDTTTMTTQITGITFTAGQTYHITVRVDPVNTSFGATITDGTNTGSIDGKNFRTTVADGGAAIMFGAFVPNGGGTYTFDVDNLTVAPVPEAASASLLLGGVGLLAGSSKFRHR